MRLAMSVCMKTAWLCICLCTFTVVAGCGLTTPSADSGDDDDASGDDSRGGGKRSGAIDASTIDGFIKSFCEAEAPCCVEGGLHGDPLRCAAFLNSSLGPVQYDASHGARCVAWIEQASRDYTICIASGTAPPADCDLALGTGGTKLPGESCSTSADCASSPEGEVNCSATYSFDMTIMKCQLVLDGKLGDGPCVATRALDGSEFLGGPNDDVPARGYVCDQRRGLYCDGSACAAMSGVGGPCNEAAACESGTFCDYASSTCAPRRAPGAACDSLYGQCAAGTYCDDDSRTCATSLGAGAACASSQSCSSLNCVNGTCSGDEPNLGLQLVCAP